GLGAEDRVHDFTKNAHRLLPIDLKKEWGSGTAFLPCSAAPRPIAQLRTTANRLAIDEGPTNANEPRGGGMMAE
ncbi:hypothetical protein, partial [Bradyrhizobium sp.]|uniref:hypothetical protein n=1 Tax=Bradyrhizobium sp. TaxID=376 RepID=UPI003C232ECA